MNKYFITACIFLVAQLSMAQYLHLSKYVVIANKVNIRSQPSIKAEVIRQLNQGDSLEFDENIRVVHDKINGEKGFWRAIKTENGGGYIWSETLASRVFRELDNPQKEYLFQKRKDKTMRLVVLENGKTISDKEQQTNWWKNDENNYFQFFTFFDVANFRGKSLFVIRYYNQQDEKQYHAQMLLQGDSLVLLNEDPFYMKKAIAQEKQYENKIWVYGNKVNIRSEASLDSEVVGRLNFREELEKDPTRKVVRDTIGGKEGHWYPVLHNNQPAFIWSKYIEYPTMWYTSKLQENTKYFITSKGLFLFRNGESVGKYEFPGDQRYHFEEIEEEKNLVLPNDVDFLLSLRYYGEACGVPSGENIFAIKGDRILEVCENWGVGDGGWYETKSYTLGKDKVLYFEEQGEHLYGDNLPNDMSGQYNFSEKSKVLKWNGEKLVEIPSKYSFVNQRAKEKNWDISYMSFVDVNFDGKKDIVVNFREIKSKDGDFTYYKDGGWIGVYLQKENEMDYEILAENNTIIKKGYSAINVKNVHAGDVLIEIPYYSNCIGCLTGEAKDYGYKQYRFMWEDNDLVLQETKWINEKNFERMDDPDVWLVKKYYDQKNVSFKDAK
jgi:hypothetical protein